MCLQFLKYTVAREIRDIPRELEGTEPPRVLPNPQDVRHVPWDSFARQRNELKLSVVVVKSGFPSSKPYRNWYCGNLNHSQELENQVRRSSQRGPLLIQRHVDGNDLPVARPVDRGISLEQSHLMELNSVLVHDVRERGLRNPV